MPVNLELKVKIDSHSRILKVIKKRKIPMKGILNQKDVYYSCNKGLLKLRVENNSYYLIKYIRDEINKRWSKYEILKLEGTNPEKYLNSLFVKDTIVEKERKLFIYKNTRIHLDKVKGLGNYIELETVVNKKKKNAVIEFEEVVFLLGLDKSKQIRDSYKNLLKK